MKANIQELETNSNIKFIGDMQKGFSDFKKRYQPRTNTVKYEKGDLVAYSYSILDRCKNYFSKLFNPQEPNVVYIWSTYS